MPAVECHVAKSFYYRRNFRVLRGQRFWNDGAICFSGRSFCDPVKGYNMYDKKTQVAITFAHPGVVYAPTNGNLNGALTRQTCNRFVIEVGERRHTRFERIKMELLEYVYERRQRLFIRATPFDTSDFLPDPLDWRELAHVYHAHPHIKRYLRIQGYKGTFEEFQHYERIWRGAKGFRLKLKRLEYAKASKYGRTIGDFGVQASLQGAFFTDQCKVYLASRDFTFTGGRRCRYVKSANFKGLCDVFQLLNDPTSLTCMFIHSDDAIYRTMNGLIYNLDISKCDGSHGPAVYQFLSELFPGGGDCISVLIEQLLQPVTIYSEVDWLTRSRQKVVIEALRPILYSGSTLTTLINTVAMFCIFDQLERCRAETPEEILEAAAAIGYILGDPQLCVDVGDQQFLKYSPVLINGQYVPVFNLGPMLRTFGSAKFDIAPSIDESELWKYGYQFNYLLINGMFPYVSCPFLDLLRNKFNQTTNKSSKMLLASVAASLPFEEIGTGDMLFLTDLEFFRRYRASTGEIMELSAFVEEAHGYDTICSPLVDRILGMDYGLSFS